MKSGQGFLLVFSITSLSSLNELYSLREQIIRIKDDPNVPLVIIGNKSDLEDDRAVSRARAFAVSEGWGHAPYYETSARRKANVDEAFVDLCRQIIRKDLETARRLEGERSLGRSGGSGVGGSGGAWDGRRARDGEGGGVRRRRKRDVHCEIL
jgi:Ras-related protein Rap-1B